MYVPLGRNVDAWPRTVKRTMHAAVERSSERRASGIVHRPRASGCEGKIRAAGRKTPRGYIMGRFTSRGAEISEQAIDEPGRCRRHAATVPGPGGTAPQPSRLSARCRPFATPYPSRADGGSIGRGRRGVDKLPLFSCSGRTRLAFWGTHACRFRPPHAGEGLPTAGREGGAPTVASELWPPVNHLAAISLPELRTGE